MPALNECRSDIIRMVAKGDLSSAVLAAIYEGESFIPHETELWDYKRTVGAEKADLAELARDVISFHNSFGGYLLIGVDDNGELVGSVEIPSQQIRQIVKLYCGVDIKATSCLVQWKNYAICLIYVPKRDVYQSPCAISRQGPEISRGKVIFKPGDIFFRADDSSQLIRGSDDLRFLIGDRQHSDEARGTHNSRVISNNLPDRSAIFSKFFGRDDAKESLWNWLADPFSKYRVVAGAGGVGKTSAVYSFCEDVCAEAPLGLEQVVWVSAKSRQFNAIEDKTNRLPYQAGARQFGQSYNDFESLLDAISFHLAINDEEWDGCGIPAKKSLVVDALSVIRSILVVDDLDSLSPDDQRTAVEFSMSLGGGKSRIIFTTRKNYLAPAASTYELNGLDDLAFSQYVAHLQELHKRKLSASERRALKGETAGSPLFIESIFRLLRLGERFGDAMARWKGRDGEAVRSACFQREVDQLSFPAKRVIFALAQFESAASSEIKRVAEMQTHEVESAIQELHGLFLIQSREIAGESRFSVSSSLRLMLEDVKDKIPSYKEIVRRSRDFLKEAKTGVSRNSDRNVGLAIQQAMAHLEQGDAGRSSAILAIALADNPENADLLMVYGRCLSRCDPPDVTGARKSFQRSFDLGKKEPQLFFKWLEFEVDVGNANAAIDVIGKASSIFRDENWRWLELQARAYAKRAAERDMRREWIDSMSDWKRAAGCAAKAIRLAPAPAKPSLVSFAQLVNDASWKTSGNSMDFPAEVRFRIAMDVIRQGDRRDVCIHRLLDLIESEIVIPANGSRTGSNIAKWVMEAERVSRDRSFGRIKERVESLKVRAGIK